MSNRGCLLICEDSGQPKYGIAIIILNCKSQVQCRPQLYHYTNNHSCQVVDSMNSSQMEELVCCRGLSSIITSYLINSSKQLKKEPTILCKSQLIFLTSKPILNSRASGVLKILIMIFDIELNIHRTEIRCQPLIQVHYNY